MTAPKRICLLPDDGWSWVKGPKPPYEENAIEYVRADLAAVQPSTVAALWRANGQPDPHGSRCECERASLPKGDMSDDELANRMFIADRNDLDLIVWQTAAKERIRWLSRALIAAIEPTPDPRDEVIARLVDALGETLDAIEGYNRTLPDEDGLYWDRSDLITQEIMSARAALAAAKAVQHG